MNSVRIVLHCSNPHAICAAIRTLHKQLDNKHDRIVILLVLWLATFVEDGDIVATRFWIGKHALSCSLLLDRHDENTQRLYKSIVVRVVQWAK